MLGYESTMGRTDITRRNFLFGSSQQASVLEDESGAAVVEYGLIGALIAVGLIGALSRTGRRTRRPLNCVKATMRRARRGQDTPNCAK